MRATLRGATSILGMAAVSWLACSAPERRSWVDPDHAASVESWRAERDERLRSPTGWLSLVGLFWLQDGDSTFGSAADNDLVFPGEVTPDRAGVLTLVDGRVTLEAASSAPLTHDGAPVERLELVPDTEEGRTDLELGTLQFYSIVRGDRVGVRVKDSAAPTLTGFSGMDYFPIDTGWRVEGRLVTDGAPTTIDVPNVLGTVEPSPSPGLVRFEIAGESYELQPIGEPGDDYFFVFGDATNGGETYGGGRFLYTEPADAEGRVTLDFNRSYNPPCVFTPYATCPLAPASNRLSLAITAGEKSYAKPAY